MSRVSLNKPVARSNRVRKISRMSGRKTPNRKWDKDKMVSAIHAIQSKEMGFLKAQQIFGVPRATLFRFIKKINSNPSLDICDILDIPLGRRPTFSKGTEKQLVKYCLDMDARYFGLTAKDIKRLAYQFATGNNIVHQFRDDKQSAGRKWFRKFLRRNPELSLRTPEGTSVGRIKGFNKESVDKFFEILEAEYNKHNFSANRVFNCDETGLTIVQSKQPKVLSRKGKKQVGSLTSAERGSLVTVVTCMSAGGTYVPPLVIFPRKNMKSELTNGAPPGTIFETHPSGWIQMDIFTRWFHHFVACVKPSADDPVLLILDGHFSHTRNLDLILAARDSHVTLVCLPPHSSHKLQPLDISFMHPLKSYYNDEIRMWLANHRNPVRPITHYQLSELFGKAYARAATLETAMNGFKKSGIFPLNKHVFQDYDFMDECPDISGTSVNPNVTGTSNSPVIAPSTSICDANPNQSISFEDISPLPTIEKNIPSNRGRKRGCAKTLTSTPNKDELMSKRNKPTSIVLQDVNKSLKYNQELKKEDPKFKKKYKSRSSHSSTSDSSNRDLTSSSDASSDNEDEDDAECLGCGQLWSLSAKEMGNWVKCQSCSKWAHEKCANFPGFRYLCFKCN